MIPVSLPRRRPVLRVTLYFYKPPCWYVHRTRIIASMRVYFVCTYIKVRLLQLTNWTERERKEVANGDKEKNTGLLFIYSEMKTMIWEQRAQHAGGRATTVFLSAADGLRVSDPMLLTRRWCVTDFRAELSWPSTADWQTADDAVIRCIPIGIELLTCQR